MTDQLKKVAPGDELIPRLRSARWFNSTIDAANDFKRRQQNRATRHKPILRQAGIALVKNTSESDVSRFGVLGIAGVLVSPTDDAAQFADAIAFEGDTPDRTSHLHRFAVCLEPIAAGKMGWAVVDGLIQVTIDVQASWHEHADVYDSDASKLKSYPFGAAQILWVESGTGEQQAVVRIGVPGGQTWWRGTLDETLSQGSSALATLTNAGTVTVYDNFLGTGESLSSGGKIGVEYEPTDDKFWATEAEC